MSGRARWLLLLFALGLVSPRGAAAADDKVADRVEYLNKKAMEDYDALEFDSARRTLVDCIAKLRAAGLDQTPVAARTYTHLGIVYIAGLHDRGRGQKQFERALAIDPTLKLDPTVATPELQEVWDTSIAALPRKKRQQAEGSPAGQNTGGATLPPAHAEPAQNGTSAATEKELLRHTPVEDATVGQRLPIYAHPTTSISKATLFYRTPGQESYTQVTMGRSRKVAGDIVGYVPAEALTGRSVQYYIEVYSVAGSVLSRQGSAESPFIVTVAGGKAAPPIVEDREEKEDPLAQVRREQALASGPKPFREHVYFDVALGTGGAVITSATTTEVAWSYDKPSKTYLPVHATSGGFIWGGAAVRGEVGAYIYKGLTIGVSGRVEFFLNNNADSSGSPGGLLGGCGAMMDKPCFATTGKAAGGGQGLLKVRYQFLRHTFFRPYVHFDVGGGVWRGSLDINAGPSSNAYYPTDQCSASYNGNKSSPDPPDCSGNGPGFNPAAKASTNAMPLNRVCLGGGSCIDSVVLGYGLIGGGAGFYVGGKHFGFTADVNILATFGGAQFGLLIDTYVGPQFIF